MSDGLQNEPGAPASGEGSAGKKAEKLATFVAEYLADPRMNATRAAIRAGAAEKSAHVTASRWMKNPWVKKQIAQELKERRKALKITGRRVLEELAKIAFSNMQNYIGINDAGEPFLDFSELNPDQAAAIQEITSEVYVEPLRGATGEDVEGAESDEAQGVEETLEPQPHGGGLKRRRLQTVNVKRTKFKLASKTPALELLGKNLKLFHDTVEHKGKLTVVVDL